MSELAELSIEVRMVAFFNAVYTELKATQVWIAQLNAMQRRGILKQIEMRMVQLDHNHWESEPGLLS